MSLYQNNETMSRCTDETHQILLKFVLLTDWENQIQILTSADGTIFKTANKTRYSCDISN